jgi:hypothetical protein
VGAQEIGLRGIADLLVGAEGNRSLAALRVASLSRANAGSLADKLFQASEGFLAANVDSAVGATLIAAAPTSGLTEHVAVST